MSPVQVYDGLERLGELVELGPGEHEAFDTAGNLIGCFPTAAAAQTAIIRAAADRERASR